MSFEESNKVVSDVTAIEVTVPEDQWRKFHPITPVAYLGSFWIILVAVIFSAISSVAEEEGFFKGLALLFSEGAGHYWLIFLGIAALVSVAIIVISWLMWRKMSYAILADGVHHRTGILFKKHSQMRWDRIQTVEVEQKLLGRLFGFGSVKLDSAGSDNVELGLLRLADCAALRAEILRILHLARSGESFTVNYNPVSQQPKAPQSGGEFSTNVGSFAGMDALSNQQSLQSGAQVWPQGTYIQQPEILGGAAVSGAPLNPGLVGAQNSSGIQAVPILDADDAENDQLVYELSFGRLLVASFTSDKFWILLLIALPSVVSIFTALSAGIFTSIIAVVGIVTSLVSSVLSDFGTRVYLSGNGLRRRAGLTRLTTRTFPPARIHAIEISQQFLWRRWDWWSVKITVAGLNIMSDSNDDISGNFVLAGKREEVIRLLWTMIPDFGIDNHHEFLREAFEGLDSGKYFRGSPKSARIFDPISLRGRGFFASKQAVVIRKGRFARSLAFIFQDHTQSISMESGPLKRRRNLVNLSFHTVLGTVTTTAKHLDAQEMKDFFWEEVELSAKAREEGVSETLQAWRERVGV